MSRFQILSLSGGGYMGLYTACVLQEIEKQIGEPIGKYFDLICGTSIGGILALGVAFEKPAADMAESFIRHGEKIFPPNRSLLQRVFSPAYCAVPLRKAVTEILCDNKRLGEALHPVLVPTLNLTKGAPQVFKTPHNERLKTDWLKNPVDIAMATSAAPTIFPLAEIDNNLYADGGLYGNAPDMMGVHEARFFFNIPEEQIHVLSVGTTNKSFSLGHSAGKNLGVVGWMQNFRLLRATMTSQQQLVHYMMGHMLEGRYMRIDTDQSEEQSKELGLDNASPEAISTLRGLATHSAQAASGKPEFAEFFKQLAPAPEYYYGPKANDGPRIRTI
ncbi:MAG: patatin-like phospholipase family protein [Gammaproteobacteria bacterium]|nr:patatin-like phospholipase family protein [Gammaproteobacteria bacterium]